MKTNLSYRAWEMLATESSTPSVNEMTNPYEPSPVPEGDQQKRPDQAFQRVSRHSVLYSFVMFVVSVGIVFLYMVQDAFFTAGGHTKHLFLGDEVAWLVAPVVLGISVCASSAGAYSAGRSFFVVEGAEPILARVRNFIAFALNLMWLLLLGTAFFVLGAKMQ